MEYKLTLTDSNGIVLKQWDASTDPENEISDLFFPLRGLGVGDLALSINTEVRIHEDLWGVRKGNK